MSSRNAFTGALLAVTLAITAAPALAASYTYYPQIEVYFNDSTETWYWQEGGTWQSGPSLSVDIRQFTTGGVNVTADDPPYNSHAETTKRYGKGNARKMAGEFEDRKFTKPIS